MTNPCYGLPAGLPERGTLAKGFVQQNGLLLPMPKLVPQVTHSTYP